MTDHRPATPDPQNLGHEPDTPYAARILMISAGLVLLVAFALVAMYSLLALLNYETPERRPPSLVTLPPPPPAGPVLNPDQPRQLRELREREDNLLTHYEWVDRSQGIARIPIDRAMAILADRVLSPSAEQPPGAPPSLQQQPSSRPRQPTPEPPSAPPSAPPQEPPR
jgi:hypothetical protein